MTIYMNTIQNSVQRQGMRRRAISHNFGWIHVAIIVLSLSIMIMAQGCDRDAESVVVDFNKSRSQDKFDR